jgi:O-antigen ligase
LQNHFKDENKIEKLFKYVLYFSIFSAVFGIVEKLVFMKSNDNILTVLLGVASKATISHRIYSTFGNPNVAGHWFAVMILLSLYFASTVPEKNRKFYKSVSILFVIALSLTGSRGAYIGLLAGIPVYYFLNKDKRDTIFLMFITLPIIVLTFMPSQASNINNITGHQLDRSMVTRDMIWDGCLDMIKLKPIKGWGIMGILESGTNFISYDGLVYHAHNIWLNFMTTLGIVGLSIYMYMKFYLYKSLWILYNQNSRLVPILAGIQALIIGHGLVDFTMLAPQSGLIFISISAIISSLAMQYTMVLEERALMNPYKSLSKTG